MVSSTDLVDHTLQKASKRGKVSWYELVGKFNSQQGELTWLLEKQGKKLEDLECLQISLLLAKAKAGLIYVSVNTVR